MSADIIAFPLRVSTGLDQQRWIPSPRERRPAGRPLLSRLRASGILFAALSSWALVAGAVRLVATVL